MSDAVLALLGHSAIRPTHALTLTLRADPELRPDQMQTANCMLFDLVNKQTLGKKGDPNGHIVWQNTLSDDLCFVTRTPLHDMQIRHLCAEWLQLATANIRQRMNLPKGQLFLRQKIERHVCYEDIVKEILSADESEYNYELATN